MYPRVTLLRMAIISISRDHKPQTCQMLLGRRLLGSYYSSSYIPRGGGEAFLCVALLALYAVIMDSLCFEGEGNLDLF
jgi:hypothetical protein